MSSSSAAKPSTAKAPARKTARAAKAVEEQTLIPPVGASSPGPETAPPIPPAESTPPAAPGSEATLPVEQQPPINPPTETGVIDPAAESAPQQDTNAPTATETPTPPPPASDKAAEGQAGEGAAAPQQQQEQPPEAAPVRSYWTPQPPDLRAPRRKKKP